MRRSRKSGLKSKNPNAGSKFKQGLEPEPIDMTSTTFDRIKSIGELSSLKTSFHARMYKSRKKHFFIVTYTDEPSITFLALAETKDKAKGAATKYLKLTHPNFSGREWRNKYLTCRRRKIEEFDKYTKLGSVPIHEVMEQGGKFPCSICGEDIFTYEDFKGGRCFLLEDEGEISPHINGYVLCYKCKQKYLE